VSEREYIIEAAIAALRQAFPDPSWDDRHFVTMLSEEIGWAWERGGTSVIRAPLPEGVTIVDGVDKESSAYGLSGLVLEFADEDEPLTCAYCSAVLDLRGALDVYGDGETLVCSDGCAKELREADRGRAVDNLLSEVLR
jgi:hypothetical protein